MTASRHGRGRGDSVRYGLNLLSSQLTARLGPSRRQFVFLSHPIDGTGAPAILVRALEELAQRFDPRQIHVVAPYIESPQLSRLDRLGIRISNRSVRAALVPLQLQLRLDDFVLMNTVAVETEYQDAVLGALRSGRLAHAWWFIHEDTGQLKRFSPRFLSPEFAHALGRFVEEGRLTILVPSKKLKADYDALLQTSNVQSMLLPFDVPTEYRKQRETSDYERIRFILSGAPGDGRKGHLLALAAFQHLLATRDTENTDEYREFDLTFVGIEDDYVSQQVVLIGNAVLGERLRLFPSVDHKRALELTREANVVICCSMSEACPLVVLEGMMMGHVVVRNECGGLEEQLQDGVNGFLIAGDDSIEAFAAVLEKVLSRSQTSEERLHEMGRASQDLSSPFSRRSYVATFGLDREREDGAYEPTSPTDDRRSRP